MYEFKTIEEKAKEWGVTQRHIQHLCRNNKIEGAVKRAGVWFLPAHTPCPKKNTRIGDKPFRFVGTKKKIFESALDLIPKKGFEDVSMSDIAHGAGIKQSAVYNHFKSKQEILDTIYDFYCYHFFASRPVLEDIIPVLESGSLIDIISCFRYDFDEDIRSQMSDILRIIVQRMTTDPRATEIFRTGTLENGVWFVETGLNKAIEMGRLAPFDTHSLSVLINSVRLYELLWWLVDDTYEGYLKALTDEQKLYELTTELLTDLKKQ